MRAPPSLPFRLWRIAAGAGAALHTVAIASDVVARRLPPTDHNLMGSNEQLELAREIEACDVRLRLLPAFDGNDRAESMRRGLERRREDARARLDHSRQLAGGQRT